MKFTVRLHESLNDTHRKYLTEAGYAIIFEDKILPDLIIVSTENVNIQKLESMDFIKKASHERTFTIDSKFTPFK